MSSWSLLLCEGPHDQEFLCCLATSNSIWKHEKSRPQSVPAMFTGIDKTKYLYLTKNNNTLVVAGMNGIGHIIPEGAKNGTQGLELAKNSSHANAIGVMLDADDVGVAARIIAVRTHYGSVVPSAATVEHNLVVRPTQGSPDQRAFGLWVAPNGIANGSLDALIRNAADVLHPSLTPIADSFVTDLGNSAKHQWDQYREKAVLTCLGQLWQAGGSLASTISANRDKWMSQTLAAQQPFADMLDFMNRLVQ